MSRTDRIKWAGAGPPVQKEAGIGLSENIERVEEISGSGGIFFFCEATERRRLSSANLIKIFLVPKERKKGGG